MYSTWFFLKKAPGDSQSVGGAASRANLLYFSDIDGLSFRRESTMKVNAIPFPVGFRSENPCHDQYCSKKPILLARGFDGLSHDGPDTEPNYDGKRSPNQQF
jgi:hypothetical protein